MKGRDIVALVIALVVVFAAAAIGSQFMPGEWYRTIAKPDWTPPNAVFGPVWTLLYAMMAVAAWLVWRERDRVAVGMPLGLFALQLALNVMWSWLFFGEQRPDLAMLDIAGLWLALFATLIAFWRVRPLPGWLLVPYLAWVTFAAALNWSIWQLN